jgi:formylglycine-generating enzyme required for sulfatase activity
VVRRFVSIRRAILAASLGAASIAPPAAAFMSPAGARRPALDAEMVYVPGAKLKVGAPARWGGARAGVATDPNAPAGVEVTVRSFWIDRTEVTAGAYARCVDAKGCPALVDGDTSEPAHTPACTVGKPVFERHPANCVTYADAAAYCAWVKKRLPGEAEFELAARGPSGRAFPWGDEPPTPKHVNACDARCVDETHRLFHEDSYENLWADTSGDDGFGLTAPVGSYPAGASPYGALDLAGNVEEWVADAWGETPGVPPSDPQGAQRIVRGGSWDFSTVELFAANRRAEEAGTMRAAWLGFRCARDP